MLKLDPYIDDVVLCLPMMGEGGGTSFIDVSPHRVQVTAYGNARTVETSSLYYGSCGYFDGSGDYLRGRVDASMALSADFTFELWLLASSLSSARVLYSQYSSSSNRWHISVESSGKLQLYYRGSSLSLTEPGDITAGGWAHIAIVRSGSTLSTYVNGELKGAIPFSETLYESGYFYVGVRYTGSYAYYYYGRMQDLCITKAARYVSDFMPPRRRAESSRCGYCMVDANSILQPIAGNATRVAGGPIDYVVIRDWGTRGFVGETAPDQAGAWSIDVPPGTYDITYLADGCAPICHGPYTIAAP